MEKKKLISISTPCYNEEENVLDVYHAIKKVFDDLPEYRYEHVFIDNCSSDRTAEILKNIAAQDKNVKIIINIRNFGHIRSPYYGMLQTKGDALIPYYCDLQDPPEIIKEFIKKWEDGYKIVLGIKNESMESSFVFFIRKMFYTIIENISEVDHIRNFVGFGLYDRSFIDILHRLNDPYPYFRGLVAEFGQNRTEVFYTQQQRKKGQSKNNLYTLYDNAMLGFVNHSKVPIRLASFSGFVLGIMSIIAGLIYFIYKLLFWDRFQVGMAPLILGLFFFSSVQLFFLGIIGEYIGAIFTQVKNKPMVIESERVNFDDKDG